MYNSNGGGNVTPRQPNRPTNEKPNQLTSSPIQRRRRTTPGGTSITNEEVMYNTTQTPPDYSTPTKGGNGNWVATKDNKNALLASRRKDTVKNVLEEIGILDSQNSTGIPFGATKEKNQYLLLTAPRNQRFLAQLGLNEEVSSKIPQKRKEIVELFHQLDPDLSGWITTGHLLQYFHKLDLPLTTSEIERLVKMCDLNEDGFIQPVDLVNALQKMQPMQSVGRAGAPRGPLGPWAPGPLGQPLDGRPVGPLGPWAPWAAHGRAPRGPLGPLGGLWMGAPWAPWAPLGQMMTGPLWEGFGTGMVQESLQKGSGHHLPRGWVIICPLGPMGPHGAQGADDDPTPFGGSACSETKWT